MLDRVDVREEILRKVGEYHFGDRLDRAASRKAVKSLFNALDNDGCYAAWRRNYDVPPGTAPMRGCQFAIEANGGRFHLPEYIRSLEGNTEWLAQRLPAMSDFVVAFLRDQGERKHPERTLKSYVFQEAEAISRMEKLRWAEVTGRTAVNLQHDGVLLQVRPYDDVRYVERQLTGLCAAALGYAQPVSHKAW